MIAADAFAPEGTAEPASPATSLRVLRSYLRLPPEPGGMEVHIARLGAAQRAQGVEVVNLFHTGEAEGPHLRLLPGRDLGSRALMRSLRFYGAAWTAAPRLRAFGPFDALHVHGDMADFLAARALARRLGVPVLAATVHDALTPRSRRLARRALGAYALVLATGREEQETLQALLGRPVHHLPSAPAPAFADVTPEPPAWDVIGVGGLLAKKRPDLFLDCAARRPDLRFALLGDGPLRPTLEARRRAEGLGNVALLGSRPPAEVAQALARSRAFLSTSRTEGTPTAALEAMAVGLPVVLTPSNRYDWLVAPGVNGWVTQGSDPEEIVARLDDVLADEDRRRAMGEANRRKLRAHGWDASAARVSALMRDALGARA